MNWPEILYICVLMLMLNLRKFQLDSINITKVIKKKPRGGKSPLPPCTIGLNAFKLMVLESPEPQLRQNKVTGVSLHCEVKQATNLDWLVML